MGCRELAARLSIYGPHDQGSARAGSYVASRSLYRTLPEDDYDRQPLVADRWLIVADLRIDNRDELASELGFGTAQLARTSDAELFLRSWSRWREETLKKLNGDYAVAVFDIVDQSLTLARDPFGQRPLHYRQTDELLAFASMPQPLANFSGLPCGIDEWHLAEFISDLPISGTRSFYNSVRRVEPGCMVRIRQGQLDAARFWSPSTTSAELFDDKDYGEELRHELDQAVRRKSQRRRGPLGSHLSAGWDSSAVTTSAALQLLGAGEQLFAYTAAPAADFVGNAPDGWLADESPLAASTAEMHQNIVHEVVRSRPFDLRNLFAWTHPLAGRPVGSVFNHQWWQAINEAASERGVRVILTAEAGNFTFSFGRLHEPLGDLFRQGRLWRLGVELRILMLQGMSLPVAINKCAGGLVPPRLYRALKETVRGTKPSPRNLTFLHPSWEQRMELRHRTCGWDERPSSDSRVRRFEHLRMADSGTFRKLALARWGIEERDPTADLPFVNFCLSLPPRAYLNRGNARPAARAALTGRVPETVLKQGPRGMQSADWYTLIQPTQVRDLLAGLSPSDSVIDYEDVAAAVRDWPESGFNERHILFRYQGNLFRALAAAHFANLACG